MSKEMFFLMDCPLNTSVMGQGQYKTSLDNANYLDTWFTMPRPCAVTSFITLYVSL